MHTTDRTGQMVRNYRVLRTLGNSPLATIYLAQQTESKAQVVLKVFHTLLSPQDQNLFLSQAQAIAHLMHPNIVPLLDYGVEDAFCFLVIAFVSDETFHQCFPLGSPLSVSHVLPFVKQLAAALSYAHARNIVHQNIKPENMFLDQNGNVALTDFTLPILLSHASAQKKGESFLAPELVRGKATPASDQYALASIAYEWLTGQHPVIPEMENQHEDIPYVSLRENLATLPPLVADVVQTALKSDPDQRFKSVAAFATAFEQAHAESQEFSVVPAKLNSAPQAHVLRVQDAPLEKLSARVPSTPRLQKAPKSSASSEHVERKVQRKRGRLVLMPVLLVLLFLLGALAGRLFLASHNENTQVRITGGGNEQHATPTPTRTLTPLPTATPPRVVGVVYQANWSKGWSGKGTRDWAVMNNELVNDGASYSEQPDPTILAPYTMTTISNYAVETTVHVIAGWPCFDVALRGTSTPEGWHGYKAAVCDQKIRLQADNAILATVPFNPGTIWHTYRFEVKDSRLSFFVDGHPLAETYDTRYRTGGQVGLKSYGTQLEIRSFQVIAL